MYSIVAGARSKTNAVKVLQKQVLFIISLQVMNHGSMRMNSKQNNSSTYASSKTSQIPRKLFVAEVLRSRWLPVSSAKLVMCRLFYLSIVGRSILSRTPQFVYLKSSEKFEKRKEKTFHCPPRQCKLSYIGSNHRLLTGQNFELMDHSPYIADYRTQ